MLRRRSSRWVVFRAGFALRQSPQCALQHRATHKEFRCGSRCCCCSSTRTSAAVSSSSRPAASPRLPAAPAAHRSISCSPAASRRRSVRSQPADLAERPACPTVSSEEPAVYRAIAQPTCTQHSKCLAPGAVLTSHGRLRGAAARRGQGAPPTEPPGGSPPGQGRNRVNQLIRLISSIPD